MKEVKHILRQNGPVIEEIIAIRNGRTVRYLKKDSQGKITRGTRFIGLKTPIVSVKAEVIAPKPKKIGFTQRLSNFLDNDSILE